MVGKAKHLQAAERALGLEPIGPETRAESELRQAWERRFAPLGLALPPVQPPDEMWYRVLRSLDQSEDRAVLHRVRQNNRLWRSAAFAATALAAGFAYLLFNPLADAPETGEPVAPRYVAVITPEGAKASLIVEVDLETKTATVRPVGVSVEAGKDLELWRIAPESAPESLGVIPPDGVERLDVSASPGDTFAVTLEPEGGSPTDGPTGPVVYSGELVAVPE